LAKTGCEFRVGEHILDAHIFSNAVSMQLCEQRNLELATHLQ